MPQRSARLYVLWQPIHGEIITILMRMKLSCVHLKLIASFFCISFVLKGMHLVLVWIALKRRLHFGEAAFSFFSFFFFFSRVFGGMRLLFNEQYMNSSRKCWLFPVNSASVHCLRTHKFHFLSNFSLKMGPTARFTHLKIILLQWFQQ